VSLTAYAGVVPVLDMIMMITWSLIANGSELSEILKREIFDT
jgi:hypothetical protein